VTNTDVLLAGVIQEQFAHLVLAKGSHQSEIGQIQVSWSAAEAAVDEDSGRLQVNQYNVSWTITDDGSCGEMCVEPHVHKCSIPATHAKYVSI